MLREFGERMSGGSGGQSVHLPARASFLEDDDVLAHLRTNGRSEIADSGVGEFAFQPLPLRALKVQRLHLHLYYCLILWSKTGKDGKSTRTGHVS